MALPDLLISLTYLSPAQGLLARHRQIFGECELPITTCEVTIASESEQDVKELPEVLLRAYK